MNERIQELKKQCYRLEDPEGLFPREVFDEDKFAELIVKECMLCCERVISDPVLKSVDSWLNQCIDEIKHHFGVE